MKYRRLTSPASHTGQLIEVLCVQTLSGCFHHHSISQVDLRPKHRECNGDTDSFVVVNDSRADYERIGLFTDCWAIELTSPD